MKKYLYLFTYIIILLSAVTCSKAFYWEKVTGIPSPYNNNYWLDVYFLPSNPAYGWICGFNGRVIRTTDGGNTWQGTEITAANQLESIIFPSTSVGYTSGNSYIFKSTDGGVTWTDVTPTNAQEIWGTYFVDDNNGVVIGGGCINGLGQHFWKTTDGGATWNDFTANEPNSGLTDAILYSPNGEGYASSSGKIWKTTDGGLTWSVFSTTGTNIWQEEITRYNNSFLVPYAGSSCSGGFTEGGMRFSVDNGQTWRQYSTGAPMFGAFLINDVTGWACGYDRHVWYTEDGGQTWQERNCGIDNAKLDDIWFINSTTGWVVGEGVFKLAPDKHLLTKNSIDFGKVCLPGFKTDTLWLKNYSFNTALTHLDIRNNTDNSYSVIQPASDFTAWSCDSIMLIVRFKPTRSGDIAATLVVSIGSDDLEVALSGNGYVPSAKPVDTLLVINPVSVGTSATGTIKWYSSQTDEFITDVKNIDGNKFITQNNTLPIRITNTGTDIKFNVSPKDTGWSYARFKIHQAPCDNDTFVTVKVYGVSPVISSDKRQLDIILQCKNERFDTIAIKNSGNSKLNIATAQIIGSNTGFTIVGWKSKKSLPLTIDPGSSDSIILKFSPPQPGTYNAVLRLVNNDSTTANGLKNPYEIQLSGTYTLSSIALNNNIIDFGDVCIGSTATRPLLLKNIGSLSTEITFNSIRGMFYSLSCGTGPISIRNLDSVACDLSFTPSKTGDFLDSLMVMDKFCNKTTLIVIKGRGINGDISVNPSSISIIMKTGKTFTQNISIKAIGTEKVTITSIKPAPDITGWTYTINPALPVEINPGESRDFAIIFNAATDINYTGQLCVHAESKCPVDKCIPLNITSNTKNVSWNKNLLDFGYNKCNFNNNYDTLVLRNEGSLQDTILRLEIVPGEDNFRIINKPSLPYTLGIDSLMMIIIEYFNPIEGRFDAKLVFELTSGNGDSIEIPITGEFRKTNTSIDVNSIDFGKKEVCSPDSMITINLVNSGTLDDTLYVDQASIPKGYYFSPNDTIIVPGNNTNKITIRFIPQAFISPGQVNGKIIMRSCVCPGSIELDVNAEIIQPNLTIKPRILDFGSILKGDSKTDTVFVENTSGYSKELTKALINSMKSNFKFSLNLPRDVTNNSTFSIPIEFFASDFGSYQDTLFFYSESICHDTDLVILKALVPTEIYDVTVRAGDYSRNPGDTLVAAISLDKAVQRANSTKISMDLYFDRNLFLPVDVFVRDGKDYKSIPFKYDFESLFVEIDSSFSKSLLSSEGDIFHIRGTMLLSLPDSTPLKINKFDVNSDKTLNIHTIDGSIQLTNFCKEVGAWRYVFTPEYSVTLKQQIIERSALTLNVNSTGSQNLTVSINDLLGRKVYESTTSVGNGETPLIIDTSNLSEGLYNIMVNSSENSHVWHERFVISR